MELSIWPTLALFMSCKNKFENVLKIYFRNNFQNNNPFDDPPQRDNDSVGNPFGSASNLNDEPPKEEEVVKRREKKSNKSQNKFGRNSLIGSLGLGSHKEDTGQHEEEIARLRQENEWYNRKNKILQEENQLKVFLFESFSFLIFS